MKDNSGPHSLLPYLNGPGERLLLKPSLVSEDGPALEKTDYPFLAVTDSDPINRPIEALLSTSSGSEIAKLFLLVQRDKYIIAKDELWPVNNRDIEDSWERAFVIYSSGKGDSAPVIFAEQTDEKGTPAPLSSLFFCKTRRLFFHPPCPKCGTPLELCRDDNFLTGSGLPPYYSSLNRYLFCRSCASSGKLEFFAYELEQSDTPVVKDRWSLIRKFRLLNESGRSVSFFPCIGCPNDKECFGPDQRVLSRIVPFSFYPFYMFAFRAMSLNALDYLALVSGVSPGELESALEKKGESGRARCLRDIHQGRTGTVPALFGADERRFLETLYLKLSFLGEVFESLPPGNDLFRHPDLRLSADRIWVRLGEHGGLLPFLWNFRVVSLDIFRHPEDMKPVTDVPGPDNLFFMALLWFHALLVNSRQDVSRVRLTLKEIADRSLSQNGFSFEQYLNDGTEPCFLPGNIFWEPEGKTADDAWRRLWDKSLCLGWLLLRSGLSAESKFSPEDFRKQYEELRGKIREGMFAGPSEGYRQATPPEDAAIYRVLTNIQARWKAETATVDEGASETVVLSPAEARKESAPALPAEEESDIVSETVIIAPKRSEAPAVSPEKTQTKKTDEVPPETVIISARDVMGTQRPSEGQHKGSEQDRQAPPSKEAEEQKPEDRKKKKADVDFLAETVILKPGDIQGKGKK